MEILIIAGEKSGDKHAAAVVKTMLSHNSKLKFWGTGGIGLQQNGVKLIANINDMSCIGLLDSLKKLGYFLKLKKQILKKVKQNPPKLAILVDFSGFNLRVAKQLKQMNIPVLYFIIPKFWAWGPKRINKIKKYINHSAVILPFEEQLLKAANIPCTYVGNPLITQVKMQKNVNKLTLGLIPGSRVKEVTRLLPLFIKTANLVQAKIDIDLLISKSDNLPGHLYKNIPKNIKVLANAEQVMNQSSLVLIASGTATLEAALLETPMVISYKTDAISAWLFKHFANCKWVGLPNIIANKTIAPEVLQDSANTENLSIKIIEVISNLEEQKKELKAIKQKLQTNNNYGQMVAKIAEKILNDSK